MSDTRISDVTKPRLLTLLSLVGLALAFTISNIWNAAPAVMGDEDVYSTYARFANWNELYTGGYLYSLIYSSVEICGPHFYSCAKALNILFLVMGTSLTFIWSYKLIGVTLGLISAAIVFVSPFSLYSSVFMPETPFYFFISLAVFFLMARVIREVSRRSLIFWALASAFSMLLASLIKPHAILLLPAFAIVWVYFLDRELTLFRAAAITTGLVSAVLLIRGSIEGVFTGGQNFSPLSFYFSFNPFDAAPDAESSVGSGSTRTLDASIAELFFNQLGLFVAVMVVAFFAVVPLVLIIMGKRNIRLFGSSPLSFLSTMTLLLLGNLSAVAVFFNVYITLMGDDHTSRVLFRYVEFIVPLLIITLLATLFLPDNGIGGFRPKGFTQIGWALLMFSLLAGLVGFTDGLSTSAADAMFASSLGNSLLWLVIALVGVGLAFTVTLGKQGLSRTGKVSAITVLGGMAVVGVLGGNQFAYAHQPQFIEGYELGQHLIREYQDPNYEIVVVGEKVGALGTAKMLGRNPSISYIRLDSGAAVTDLESDIVAIYDGLNFQPDDYSLVHTGSDFRIFELADGTRINGPVFPTGDVSGTQPPLVQASNFAFAVGQRTQLELSRPITNGESLEMCVVLDARVEMRTVAIQIGDQEVKQAALPDGNEYCLEIIYDLEEPTRNVLVASGFLEIFSADNKDSIPTIYGLEYYETRILPVTG